MKKAISLLITILILIFSIYQVKAKEIKQQFQIEVNDLKPGDIVIKQIDISNFSSNKINYTFDITYISGDIDFYNILIVKLKTDKEVQYNKSINSYKKQSGQIEKNENFYLVIIFPEECGSEYGNKSVKFNVSFTLSDIIKEKHAEFLYCGILISLILSSLVTFFYFKLNNNQNQ